jgi:hypothetical protein
MAVNQFHDPNGRILTVVARSPTAIVRYCMGSRGYASADDFFVGVKRLFELMEQRKP